MAPQAYKVIATHDNEVSGWKIISRIIHASVPHVVQINDDVQYE